MRLINEGFPSQNPHFLLIILDKLLIRSDLVRFEQILCVSKIERSIIP